MTCDVKNKSELKIELNSLNGNWFFGGWIGIGIAIHLKNLYESELELELEKFSDQLLISGFSNKLNLQLKNGLPPVLKAGSSGIKKTIVVNEKKVTPLATLLIEHWTEESNGPITAAAINNFNACFL